MTTSSAQQRHREYIDSPVWKRRRARYLASHYPKCAACGTSYGIEVHHRTYDNAFQGQELDADLVAVCRDHHQRAHDLFDTGAYASLDAATRAMLAEAGGSLQDAPVVVRLLRKLFR
ncbi:MAG TPA: HNH endonuclease signature motif containing protein [Nakamurella sp.]